MNSLLDTLRTICAGRDPAGRLLQSCRFEGLGGYTLGRESILDWMRRQPIELSSATASLETSSGFALFGLGPANEGPTVFFGDCFDEKIGRLWCLSDVNPAIEDAVVLSVASDVDLDQRGGGILLEPGDHPDLQDIDVDRLRNIATRLVAELLENGLIGEDIRLLRVRAFIRRAFSDKYGGAALIGIDAITAGSIRKPLGFNVAVLLTRQCGHSDAERIVIDHAGLRAALSANWTPRIDSPAAHCTTEPAL